MKTLTLTFFYDLNPLFSKKVKTKLFITTHEWNYLIQVECFVCKSIIQKYFIYICHCLKIHFQNSNFTILLFKRKKQTKKMTVNLTKNRKYFAGYLIQLFEQTEKNVYY